MLKVCKLMRHCQMKELASIAVEALMRRPVLGLAQVNQVR